MRYPAIMVNGKDDFAKNTGNGQRLFHTPMRFTFFPKLSF